MRPVPVARIPRVILPILCSVPLLAPSAALAEEIAVPGKLEGRYVRFEVRDVSPQQVMGGRLVGVKGASSVSVAQLRKAARRGRLKVKVRKAQRARLARATRTPNLVIRADVTAPSVPTGVVATPGDWRVSIKWDASTDDVGVKGYRFERDGSELTRTRKTSYFDGQVDNGTTYTYTVRAYDAAGNVSAASAPVTATPAGPVEEPTPDPVAEETTTPDAEPTPPADSPVVIQPTEPGPLASVTCGWGTFTAFTLPSACWRPYADSSFFNTPLPANPKLVPNSQEMINRIMTMGQVPPMPVNPKAGSDWYHPIYFSSQTDPLYTVSCIKYGGECEVKGMQVRIPPQARRASSSDAHMTVIDQTTGWEYDFWGVQTDPLPATGGNIVINWGGRTRIDGPGGGDADSASDANAAHTGNAGGIIRYQEMAAGRIDHALFVMVGCSNGTYVFPARGKASICSDTTNAPASGQWLRLNMTEAEIDALPVSSWQKVIFKAFAKYGGVVADTGGNESFGFELESPETYRSFGIPDPWIAWAKAKSTEANDNIDVYKTSDGVERYHLNVGRGVDWQSKLQVVDPCVIQKTC